MQKRIVLRKGATSKEIANLVLAVVDRCWMCGERFIAVDGQTIFCSDDCQRDAEWDYAHGLNVPGYPTH